MDVAPEPDGTEHNPFNEQLLFEPIGTVTNAEQQTLAALRYHQVVSRKSNDKVFHNETGYWLWDAASNVIMQTLTIPRGVALVAGGKFAGNPAVLPAELVVRAAVDDDQWSIVQSPFMRDNARTVSFMHSIVVSAERLEYTETTELEIYGRSFSHTDTNTLSRSD